MRPSTFSSGMVRDELERLCGLDGTRLGGADRRERDQRGEPAGRASERCWHARIVAAPATRIQEARSSRGGNRSGTSIRRSRASMHEDPPRQLQAALAARRRHRSAGFWNRICGAFEIRRLRRRESPDELAPDDGPALPPARGARAERRGDRDGAPRARPVSRTPTSLRTSCAAASSAGAGRRELGERDVVRAYLDFAKLDEAARAAARSSSRHPTTREALLLHGRVFHALFERDHASRDGARSRSRACARPRELDAGSIEARRSLAAIAPRDRSDEPGAVPRPARARDGPARRGGRTPLPAALPACRSSGAPRRTSSGRRKSTTSRLVEKKTRPRDRLVRRSHPRRCPPLSRMPGVRRVAMRHRGVAIVADGGDDERDASPEDDAFLASAEHLRKASSAWAKRIGMGSFEEATLSIGEATVFAVAAGGSVLALEIGPSTISTSPPTRPATCSRAGRRVSIAISSGCAQAASTRSGPLVQRLERPASPVRLTQCAPEARGRAFQRKHHQDRADRRESDHARRPGAPAEVLRRASRCPNPVNAPPTYCMPSNMPAAVAAARFPPKSIDAVPESIECTIEIANELKTNATMIQSRLGALQTTREARDLKDVADERDGRAPVLEDPVRDRPGRERARRSPAITIA